MLEMISYEFVDTQSEGAASLHNAVKNIKMLFFLLKKTTMQVKRSEKIYQATLNLTYVLSLVEGILAEPNFEEEDDQREAERVHGLSAADFNIILSQAKV